MVNGRCITIANTIIVIGNCCLSTHGNKWTSLNCCWGWGAPMCTTSTTRISSHLGKSGHHWQLQLLIWMPWSWHFLLWYLITSSWGKRGGCGGYFFLVENTECNQVMDQIALTTYKPTKSCLLQKISVLSKVFSTSTTISKYSFLSVLHWTYIACAMPLIANGVLLLSRKLILYKFILRMTINSLDYHCNHACVLQQCRSQSGFHVGTW